MRKKKRNPAKSIKDYLLADKEGRGFVKDGMIANAILYNYLRLEFELSPARAKTIV